MMRNRISKNELIILGEGVHRLASEFQPLTLRGLFYQCVGAQLIEKTESAYDQLGRIVKDLRIAGKLPWKWIIDSSRRCDRISTFKDLTDLLDISAKCFRLDPWKDQPCLVQVWVEKECLAPLFAEVTNKLRVSLYPGKGFSSLTFTRQGSLEALDALKNGKRVTVLQWGDYDPSGKAIGESLKDHYLIHGAGRAEVIRVGLLKEHVDLWGLPTRPTKQSDSRSRTFGDNRSVELDAVNPKKLKEWICSEVKQYIDQGLWEDVIDYEKKERKKLDEFIKQCTA